MFNYKIIFEVNGKKKMLTNNYSIPYELAVREIKDHLKNIKVDQVIRVELVAVEIL